MIPRVDLAQRRVVEPPPLKDAGPVVLDDDVRFGDERAQQLDRPRLAEIEAQALLAAILLHEVCTSAVLDDGQQAARGHPSGPARP